MDAERPSIRVAARLCGPPGSANGGYVSGLVAGAIEAAVKTGEAAAPRSIEEALAVDHVSRERMRSTLA